ncbi:MAG: type II toxin-antitoxin system YoeB family toxin [Bacteroidales bacterium]|nr:type II toxin-antitoxin system YoeB family toxin [Bacteroidales bacterium]
MYTLVFAPQALEDLSKLKKSEPAAFKKAGRLLVELQEHPKTGTGKPEALHFSRPDTVTLIG